MDIVKEIGSCIVNMTLVKGELNECLQEAGKLSFNSIAERQAVINFGLIQLLSEYLDPIVKESISKIGTHMSNEGYMSVFKHSIVPALIFIEEGNFTDG